MRRLALLLLLGPLLPDAALASNAYMVENITGTNGCYRFQTTPSCSATIVGISSGSIAPGSTQYIQNTGTPTTATQVFKVSSGTVSTLAANTLGLSQVGGLGGAAKLQIGTDAGRATALEMFLNRTDISGNGHGIGEYSNWQGAAGTAYASIESIAQSTGPFDYDHISCFQAEPNSAGGGALTKLYGFFNGPVNNSTNTITNSYGFYDTAIATPDAGVVTNEYGVFVETMTASQNSFPVYLADHAHPAFLGGGVNVNNSKITLVSNGTAASDAMAYGQNHIVQIVNFQSAASSTTAASTYGASLLTATITPTSASNKVRIEVAGYAQSPTAGICVFTLFRNTTNLATTASNGFVQIGDTLAGSLVLGSVVINYLDSPATTSATTYTVQFRATSGACSFPPQDQPMTIKLTEEH